MNKLYKHKVSNDTLAEIGTLYISSTMVLILFYHLANSTVFFAIDIIVHIYLLCILVVW